MGRIGGEKSKTGKSQTSWDEAGKWYHQIVGDEGHHYHQTVIIPQVLKLLSLGPDKNHCLLDLACGQGVLSRHLPPSVSYLGIDLAASLIQAAKKLNRNPLHQFLHADVTQPIPGLSKTFTHGSIILALQNIEFPLQVLKNASRCLVDGAPFIIVLNHPCFRIPRQSSWKIAEDNKIQFRRIDRYMSSMKIPIQTHPGQGKDSAQTWSFHHPLSQYTHWLKEAGFLIESIDEWCSNKTSQGKSAKMENRSRSEIPLFMSILSRKGAFA